MKKLLIFIGVLSLIIILLQSKLETEIHIAPTFETSIEAASIEKLTAGNLVEYSFSGHTASLSDELKKEADKISEKYKSTAIQIAVMKNYQLIHTYEYGYANVQNKTTVISDTKFRVASLAKFVTDAVFMKLYDEGKVSIDADASVYLGFQVRNPSYPDKIITPAMLMSHTGTVVDSMFFEMSRDNESSYSLQEILSHSETFAKAEPGNYYCYSNFSVAIIGAICELVTGKHFYELADEYFFKPLDIDASYIASELENISLLANLYGSGGLTVDSQLGARFHNEIGRTHHLVQGNLICSAKDYMKFVAMISAGGITENGERLLSENSVQEIMKSRIFAEGLGSGFGVEENNNVISGRKLYSHTGNAYGMHSAYIFDPTTGDGITILTSGASVEYLDDVGIYNICNDYVKLFLD